MAAASISVPQSNSRVIIEEPSLEVECTFLTLRTMLTTLSMGRLTMASTSAGPTPG